MRDITHWRHLHLALTHWLFDWSRGKMSSIFFYKLLRTVFFLFSRSIKRNNIKIWYSWRTGPQNETVSKLKALEKSLLYVWKIFSFYHQRAAQGHEEYLRGLRWNVLRRRTYSRVYVMSRICLSYKAQYYVNFFLNTKSFIRSSRCRISNIISNLKNLYV